MVMNCQLFRVNLEKYLGQVTFGIVSRIIVQGFLENDSSGIKSYSMNYLSPLFPDKKIQITLWREGNEIIFFGKIKESNKKFVAGVFEMREKAKM